MTRTDGADPPLDGLQALLGFVVVRIDACEARFAVDGEMVPHPRCLAAPGGTIGTGADTTIRLVGPDAQRVSRRHLAVRPIDRTWMVTDLASRNGTSEPVDGGWEKLLSWQPIPIHDGMRLRLGRKMQLRLHLEAVPLTGSTTPGEDAPSQLRDLTRVPAGRLERLALALVEPRRPDPRDGNARQQLCADLAIGEAELYRRRAELRELRPVASVSRGSEWSDLTAALATAYPYLRYRTDERAL